MLSVLGFSCSNKYEIKGLSSVSSLDGKMLFLKVGHGDQAVKIDSAEVVHGSFRMSGSVDKPQMASLYMDDRFIMPFVIECGQINICINNVGMSVDGTTLNDSFNSFVEKQNALNDRAYEVETLESKMIMDGVSVDKVDSEVSRRREILCDEMNGLVKDFIRENYDNVLGTGVFLLLCGDMVDPMRSPLVKEILDNAPDVFKDNPEIKEFLSFSDY